MPADRAWLRNTLAPIFALVAVGQVAGLLRVADPVELLRRFSAGTAGCFGDTEVGRAARKVAV